MAARGHCKATICVDASATTATAESEDASTVATSHLDSSTPSASTSPQKRVSATQNLTAASPSSEGSSDGWEAVEADSPKDATPKCPDSACWPEGFGSTNLPVEGARLYNLAVQPVSSPSWTLKLLAFPVFWLVCLTWHKFQRQLQLEWQLPGQPGESVVFHRTLPSVAQVALNVACVVVISCYALSAYIFHHRIMDKLLNPLLIPRTWGQHVAATIIMVGIAIASCFILTTNWVVGAAGLFLFFGWALCGRIVQESASHRGQVSLGPSRAAADTGMSFHVGGRNLEGGQGQDRTIRAKLMGGEAGFSKEGCKLRFANLETHPFTQGDDAVLLEEAEDGTYTYHGPCGRANIFRQDIVIAYLITMVFHAPQFLIGAGNFNQCVGVAELVCSLLYIPIGYTCFAAFGFRIGLSCKWNTTVIMLLTVWPLVNLILGGKGCATLTDLIAGKYLPQIWESAAAKTEFSRGFAECAGAAHRLGGETLMVASTTAAAWVHIMSNFSFLLGFASGLLRKACKDGEKKDVVVAA